MRDHHIERFIIVDILEKHTQCEAASHKDRERRLSVQPWSNDLLAGDG